MSLKDHIDLDFLKAQTGSFHIHTSDIGNWIGLIVMALELSIDRGIFLLRILN